MRILIHGEKYGFEVQFGKVNQQQEKQGPEQHEVKSESRIGFRRNDDRG